MYSVLRRFLFLFPAEAVHHFSMKCLGWCCSVPPVKQLIRSWYGARNMGQPVQLAGLNFRHPVGLAAGFDKNACYLSSLEALGFAFVEIGTVTPLPQSGNDKPRLFRLPEDRALINRMGFNNDGVDAVVTRLRRWRERKALTAGGDVSGPSMLIGGNIGKNKITPNESAVADYELCFRKLAPYVDYFVVNVSSPNTPGLRELQEKAALKTILVRLQEIRQELLLSVPVFLKIAPDLSDEQLADVADLAKEIRLDGLVATNTTIARDTLSDAGKIRAGEIGAGGLSGAPLKAASTRVLALLHQQLGSDVPLMASGGIFTGEDAREKLQAGASLVQVWTGFIYQGPGIVQQILRGL